MKLFSSVFTTPVPGLTISADFYLVFSASGEAKIEAKLSTGAGFEFDGKRLEPVSTSDFSYNAFFDAEVGAGLKPELTLAIYSLGMADVAPEAGVKVEGSFARYKPDLTCADLSAWVYMDIAVGEGDTALGFVMNVLDMEKEYHPLNKDNSKISSIHVENGKIVSKCTAVGDLKPGGDGGEGDIPEPEDNGYGETPIFRGDATGGAFGYGNYLAEPFNVPAGKAVSIGGSDHKDVTFGYSCDPGTVYKLTKKEWDGSVVSESVNAFVYSGSPWYDDCIWEIEVYCGRVVIDDITAWGPPPVSLKNCAAIKYPLRISDSSVVMHVGETYSLSSENDFKELTGESVTPIWGGGRDSQDTWIVNVDKNGVLKADKRGTATVTAEIKGLYKRTCTVTVI